jgi:hypothetical protein
MKIVEGSPFLAKSARNGHPGQGEMIVEVEDLRNRYGPGISV